MADLRVFNLPGSGSCMLTHSKPSLQARGNLARKAHERSPHKPLQRQQSERTYTKPESHPTPDGGASLRDAPTQPPETATLQAEQRSLSAYMNAHQLGHTEAG